MERNISYRKGNKWYRFLRAVPLLILVTSALCGCQPRVGTGSRTSVATFVGEDVPYLQIAFEYPKEWEWLRGPVSSPGEIYAFNPEPKPGKEDSGVIIISADPYDLYPEAYHSSIDICLIDTATPPEVLLGARKRIADRETEIDGFPARWITIHQEPYYQSELDELVECIVIDAEDRAYTIIAHIAVNDVEMKFGKGFYHLVETLEINP